MCINPLLYICRVMDRVTINNKKHFTFDLSHHSFDKAKKDMIIKATLENHKVEMPPVIDRRDHITSKALACPGDYRGLPTTPVGSTSRMIRTQPHLVTPVNQGVFLFGLFLQRWIFLLQPTFDCLWVLFIGTPDWLLGCETPTQEIPTHCPYRKLNTESFINQLRYSFSSPQIKGKFQLLRMTVCYRLRYLSCLTGKEGTPFRTTFLFRLKRFLSISTILLYPFTNRLSRYTEYLGYFNLSLTLSITAWTAFFEYLPELQVEGNEHLLFSCLYFIKFVIENANYIML